MRIVNRRSVCFLLTVSSAILLTAFAVDAAGARRSRTSGPERAAERAARQDSNGDTPTLKTRGPQYQVQPGDVLELSFAFTPAFDQTLTVRPDGFVTLRVIGSFYAEGKTTVELENALRAAYSKVLHDPVITVNLSDFQKPYFIAGGQVGHPGKYDLRQQTTLAEAVEIAGGMTDRSKASQVLLFRRVSASYFEVTKVNVKKMFQTTNRQEDIYLRPGDMVYVPQNRISKLARFLPTSSMGMYFSPYTF